MKIISTTLKSLKKELISLCIIAVLSLLFYSCKDNNGSDDDTPIAIFTVTPESGNLSTIFAFDASGCTDNNDNTTLLQIRWDWENDGTWDTEFSNTKTANHQFTEAGTYTVNMEVKNTKNKTDSFSLDIIVDNNTPPIADFTFTPENGTTATVFTFDASSSSDNEDNTDALKVRWDWENDGTWDTDFSTTKTATHQFSTAGDYTVNMEVKDTKEVVSNKTATINITEGNITGTFTDDRDQHIYKTVKIGDQWWMAENLNFYTGGGSWIYDNDPANEDKYGRMYNWATATGVCPDGWHIPTDDEWKTLEIHLGMTPEEANKYNWRGTDQGTQLKDQGSSGFDVLMGGYRFKGGGGFLSINKSTSFWTATESGNYEAWIRSFDSDKDNVYRFTKDKGYGYYIRCVKD